MDKTLSRSSWNSQLGFLLAAIGSAVGLGNIWRFPFIAFKYGGGAFLVPYAIAFFIAGVPLLILEYGIGHRELGSSPLSFARVGSKWEWVGWWMPLAAMFGIMLYYTVIIGYCVIYFFLSMNLTWGADTESFFFNSLLQITNNPFNFGGINLTIASATLFVWMFCWIICYQEIHAGIEIANKIFIPLLFVLILLLVGWGLTLPGAKEGVIAYIKPNWDTIKSVEVWSAAFGHIFFTLSLGFGIMITYASYLPHRTKIFRNALVASCSNSFFEVVAGVAVFSVIGFMAMQKGLPVTSVVKQGPQLAFVVYPEAINKLPFLKSVFGMVFFLVLILAGITSAISLIEALACSVQDKFGWGRKKIVSVICLIGFTGSLIFTTRSGLLIIDITDHFITNYGLILGGIFECFIVGWVLKSRKIRDHINSVAGKTSLKLGVWWEVVIRYITPSILIILVCMSLANEIKKPFGDYPIDAVILFGVDWLIILGIMSVVLTFYPWKPELLERKHKPEEDRILT